MSKPYDAAAKELFQTDPAGWAKFLGVDAPRDRISLLDTDLAATSAAADKVARVDADPPFLLNVEFQSWSDRTAPAQLLGYFAGLHRKYHLPVRSVLVVLVREADSRTYDGHYTLDVGGRRVLDFRYDVVRVWELPHAALLAGPLALLPLAPIADVTGSDPESVFRRAAARLEAEAAPDTAGRLMAAVGILLGMRYGKMTAQEWMDKFPEVAEWPPFALWIKNSRERGEAEGQELGRANEARALVLRQGRKKFGEPTAEQAAALGGMTDLPGLEALAERLLDVNTWADLLAPAAP